MAGGTWDAQNKVLPGVYINFETRPTTLANIGDRGIVTIAANLDWGPLGDFIEITNLQEVYQQLGYDITDDNMMFVQQIFRGCPGKNVKGANKLLVYRKPHTGAVKAAATVDGLTATAKYEGVKGNSISIVITPDPDTEVTTGQYAVLYVETVVDNAVRDRQIVGRYVSDTDYTPPTIGDLQNNTWVDFSGTATANVPLTAGSPLTGGNNGVEQTDAYSQYMEKLESKYYNVVIYGGEDQTVKTALAMFTQSRGYDNGRYTQLVTSGYSTADSEFVISVENGLVLNTGQTLEKEQATWWVGGCTAAATSTQNLTYGAHPDAVAVSGTYTASRQEEALRNGQFIFVEELGEVKVLSDINTFTSFVPLKGEAFSQNRAIRFLWGFANDIYNLFATYYIGKVDNIPDGRLLFKKEVIAYGNQAASIGAIYDFDGVEDIEVLPGEQPNGIVIYAGFNVARSVDKIYIGVTIS